MWFMRPCEMDYQNKAASWSGPDLPGKCPIYTLSTLVRVNRLSRKPLIRGKTIPIYKRLSPRELVECQRTKVCIKDFIKLPKIPLPVTEVPNTRITCDIFVEAAPLNSRGQKWVSVL